MSSSLGFLHDKTILITGGSGSFGRAAAKILLRDFSPRRVIIFSRDEWKQWEMRNGDPIFSHPNIRYFLGDVRDIDRLTRAFNEVDYVIHAAALKQVPAAEYNPTEFVKTNIDGSTNVINASIDCHVRGVAALSTDKAVNPVNLYGGTKLCLEKLFTAGNVYVGKRGEPRLCVVRYGNVLGSRGSVIPYWKKLLSNGVERLPVTDLRMTRFWITLEQSVHFVLRSLESTQGGEIFVPKIPSMRIADMAQAMAPDKSVEVVGIRPGEKLHEVLVSVDESHHTFEDTSQFIIVPETRLRDEDYLERLKNKTETFKKLHEGFSYASYNNNQWLDVPALRQVLIQLGFL